MRIRPSKMLTTFAALLLSLPLAADDGFYYEVSVGNIYGHTAETKFGSNPDLDVGVTEDIWSAGTDRSWLTSADTLACVSDDLDDTSAGTGARTVRISGLDASFVEVSEDLTLNGLVAVTTANSYYRSFRIVVLSAGSSETNEGTLSCATTTGAFAQLHVLPGTGQTQLTHYTVPDNFDAYVVGAQFAVGGAGAAKRVSLEFLIREEGAAWRVLGRYFIDTAGTSMSPNVAYVTPFRLPEHADAYWRGTADDNNTEVFVQYSMVLRQLRSN